MGDRGNVIRSLVLTWSALLCWTAVLSRPKDDDFPIIKINSTLPDISESRQIVVKQENKSIVKDCKCVAQYLCEDDSDAIDVRSNFGSSTESPVCENYVEQCCNTAELSLKSIEPIAAIPIERYGCGLRNEKGLGTRIAEGNDAFFGEFPWMIMILKEISNHISAYQCGGSLIHPQVVLTAAHCVINVNKTRLKVRGGEWDTENSEESLPYQERNIKEIILQKFNRGSGYNDIALLVLEEAFVKEDNIDVICLPRPGDVIVDKDCLSTGWGLNSLNDKGKYQELLKKVDLSIVTKEDCEKIRKKGRPDYKLHESFVCASGINGADTCKGDGGSPLICPVRNGQKMQYQQVGVVSWGDGCGTETPGVYANVALFVKWIDDQLAKFGFDPVYYY